MSVATFCGCAGRWESLEMTPKLQQELSHMDHNEADLFLRDFLMASDNDCYGGANKWAVYAYGGLKYMHMHLRAPRDNFLCDSRKPHFTENSLHYDASQNCIHYKNTVDSYAVTREKFIYGGYAEGGLLQRTVTPVKGSSTHVVFDFGKFRSAYTIRDGTAWGRQWLSLYNGSGFLLLSPRHSANFSKLAASMLVLCPNVELHGPSSE